MKSFQKFLVTSGSFSFIIYGDQENSHNKILVRTLDYARICLATCAGKCRWYYRYATGNDQLDERWFNKHHEMSPRHSRESVQGNFSIRSQIKVAKCGPNYAPQEDNNSNLTLT